MEIFKIVKDSNPNLRKRSEDVTFPLDPKLEKTFLDMIEYLKLSQDDKFLEKHKNVKSGVGLAAPQIGINKNALAIYFIDDDDKVHKYFLINPVIISESTKLCFLESGEGCLSVDNPHDGFVYRPFRIKVKAFDLLKNADVVYDFKGYEAIVVQHEIDHLKGVLFYDHINKINPKEIKAGAVSI